MLINWDYVKFHLFMNGDSKSRGNRRKSMCKIVKTEGSIFWRELGIKAQKYR